MSLNRLDLHLSETMLPNGDERSNSILTVVHQKNPGNVRR